MSNSHHDEYVYISELDINEPAGQELLNLTKANLTNKICTILGENSNLLSIKEVEAFEYSWTLDVQRQLIVDSNEEEFTGEASLSSTRVDYSAGAYYAAIESAIRDESNQLPNYFNQYFGNDKDNIKVALDQPGKYIIHNHPTSYAFEYNCSKCGGTGSIICEKCSGQGTHVCSSCIGQGQTVCSKCNGTRKVECTSCSKPGNTTCYSCHGKFYKTCHICDNGMVKCNSCSGKGYNTCKTCNGKGSHACSQCSGTGKLHQETTVFVCDNVEWNVNYSGKELIIPNEIVYDTSLYKHLSSNMEPTSNRLNQQYYQKAMIMFVEVKFGTIESKLITFNGQIAQTDRIFEKFIDDVLSNMIYQMTDKLSRYDAFTHNVWKKTTTVLDKYKQIYLAIDSNSRNITDTKSADAMKKALKIIRTHQTFVHSTMQIILLLIFFYFYKHVYLTYLSLPIINLFDSIVTIVTNIPVKVSRAIELIVTQIPVEEGSYVPRIIEFILDAIAFIIKWIFIIIFMLLKWGVILIYKIIQTVFNIIDTFIIKQATEFVSNFLSTQATGINKYVQAISQFHTNIKNTLELPFSNHAYWRSLFIGIFGIFIYRFSKRQTIRKINSHLDNIELNFKDTYGCSNNRFINDIYKSKYGKYSVSIIVTCLLIPIIFFIL